MAYFQGVFLRLLAFEGQFVGYFRQLTRII